MGRNRPHPGEASPPVQCLSPLPCLNTTFPHPHPGSPPLPVRSPERVPERASSCRKPRGASPCSNPPCPSSSREPLVPCPASSAGRARHRAPDPDIPRPVPPPSPPAPGLHGSFPGCKNSPALSARTMPAPCSALNSTSGALSTMPRPELPLLPGSCRPVPLSRLFLSGCERRSPETPRIKEASSRDSTCRPGGDDDVMG